MFRDILEEDINKRDESVNAKDSKKEKKNPKIFRNNSKDVEKLEVLSGNREVDDMMSVLGFGTSAHNEQTKKKKGKRLMDIENEIEGSSNSKRKKRRKKEQQNDDSDSLDLVLKAIEATKEL